MPACLLQAGSLTNPESFINVCVCVCVSDELLTAASLGEGGEGGEGRDISLHPLFLRNLEKLY